MWSYQQLCVCQCLYKPNEDMPNPLSSKNRRVTSGPNWMAVPRLDGARPGAGWGSLHNISHMGPMTALVQLLYHLSMLCDVCVICIYACIPSSGGSRNRSNFCRSAILMPSLLNNPPCTTSTLLFNNVPNGNVWNTSENNIIIVSLYVNRVKKRSIIKQYNRSISR